MNSTILAGEGRDLAGHFKKTTGDRSLQSRGIIDQLAGALQKALGSMSRNSGNAGFVNEARHFANKRPFAAALAAVLGIAILNALRRKLR